MGVRRIAMGVLCLAGIGGLARAAQAPELAALSAVQPGQWTLTEKGGDTRTLCVSDPRVLLQIEHGNAQCSRFIIASAARTVTVHYTCPGAGHGRTTIDIEDGAQLRIETQGILSGAPFDLRYEGRRTGNCGA